MPSSGYAIWSVVADEQPTAAKWNILGSNDASFNNGNGLEDSVILNRQVAAGFVVQADQANFSAVATGTGTIPYDNTTPQITEGTEFMTLLYTPKSTTNKVIVEASAMLGVSNTNGNPTLAIFQNAVVDALAATTTFEAIGTARKILMVSHSFVAGTVSPITFRARAGNDVAATTTFNGSAGAGLYGAATKSFLRVTEFKA